MSELSDLINQRYGFQSSNDLATELPNSNATLQTTSSTINEILDRRSHRQYTDEPISEEILDTLLACAQSAPTKSNLQQYSIIVVSDSAQRQRLAEHCPKTPQLFQCPVFIVFCADMKRNQRIAEMKLHQHNNNNLDSFVNAVIDAAMAMQCFISAAESLGLGCAAISEIRDNIEKTSEILALPASVFPIAGLTLGKPASAGFINQRLAPNIVIHRDHYDDTTLEENIEAYDARRHSIFPIPDARQILVEKYGIAEHYTWSEQTARQLSIPERPNLYRYLTEKGFDLRSNNETRKN
ncbi:MAG: nitroreductase family protein [Pseudomonadales bacterium]|nr:nitroreductase family protein [Pseudomonadales bacterium]